MNVFTHPYRCPSLYILALLLASIAITSPAYAEFNPAEGAESSSNRPASLPNTDALTMPPRHDGMPNVFPAIKPGTTGGSPQSIAFPVISPTAAASVTTAPPPAPVLQPVAFPAVDAATLQGSFTPPAPLMAAQQAAAQPEPLLAKSAPVVTPIPVPQDSTKRIAVAAPQPVPLSAAVPVAGVEPAAPLSRDTKTTLSHIPSKLDAPKPESASKVSLSRVTPGLRDLQTKDKIDAYEANGIKISVRRPGLDTNYELNRAYTSLSGGDSEEAMEIYKNVLSTEPTNQDALFGLASMYHRQGQLEKARTYYAALLKVNPNHRDGLNNFLVLVSDESPQEALAELERLQQRNPDFSPIPAQQALLLHKMGFLNEAHEKMLRAIELAPNNLTYKYNLAIMLDGQGNYAEAAELYRMLIAAQEKGETLPAPAETLQKRLNYIATVMNTARPLGS